MPKIVVFDNASSAVKQAYCYDPELNPKIIAFCKHYCFALVPTRPRTPQHKGKVERGVDYVQESAIKGMTRPHWYPTQSAGWQLEPSEGQWHRSMEWRLTRGVTVRRFRGGG